MTFRLKNLHLDFVDSLEKSLRLQVNQNIEKEHCQDTIKINNFLKLNVDVIHKNDKNIFLNSKLF